MRVFTYYLSIYMFILKLTYKSTSSLIKNDFQKLQNANAMKLLNEIE